MHGRAGRRGRGVKGPQPKRDTEHFLTACSQTESRFLVDRMLRNRGALLSRQRLTGRPRLFRKGRQCPAAAERLKRHDKVNVRDANFENPVIWFSESRGCDWIACDQCKTRSSLWNLVTTPPRLPPRRVDHLTPARKKGGNTAEGLGEQTKEMARFLLFV